MATVLLLASVSNVGGKLLQQPTDTESATHPTFSHATALPLAKADSQIRQIVADSKAASHTRVIVRFTANTTVSERDAVIRRMGGLIYGRLNLIESVAATIPTPNLSKLAALASVTHLSTDAGVRKSDDFTVPHTFADVAAAPTRSGGYGLTGKGVGVAVLDSGIALSADFTNLLTSRVIAAKSFVPGIADTRDTLGHGTHVAGIIAGDGSNSPALLCYRTFYGIARQANLINVRVLDENGSGSVSDVIKGIEWVIEKKQKYNIRVLNISLGHPVYESYTTDPLCQAVEAAWNAGIVVVCSAGNAGRAADAPDSNNPDNEGFGTAYGSIASPGNDPSVITVGAMKNMDGSRGNDRIATYSSRGPSRIDMVMKPDIIAPGNRVISANAINATLNRLFGSTNALPISAYSVLKLETSSLEYFVLSGTSMAAPVVSGAAALLLEKDSTLTPDTVKARMMFAADKWFAPDGHTDPFTYGAGFLNIPGALRSTIVVPGGHAAYSPNITVSEGGDIFVDMNQAIWGSAGARQAPSIWYTGAGNSPDTVWGQQAIWGSAGTSKAYRVQDYQTVQGDRAIWGKAYQVQGDCAIWGRATSTVADVTPVSVYGE